MALGQRLFHSCAADNLLPHDDVTNAAADALVAFATFTAVARGALVVAIPALPAAAYARAPQLCPPSPRV